MNDKTAEKIDDKQWQRLEPFMYKMQARQRLIVYLLALGISVRNITKMDRTSLAKMNFRDEMEIYVEQHLEEIENEHDLAFVYPGGTSFKKEDIFRIARQSMKKVLKKPIPVADFYQYIQKGWFPVLLVFYFPLL